MQACFGDDIHTATQQFLRIQQQATQGQGAGPWGQGHQQIKVAVVVAVAIEPERSREVVLRLQAIAELRQRYAVSGEADLIACCGRPARRG